MNTKTAPTSPKYPLEQPVEQVWKHPAMTPPARIPHGQLLFYTILSSILAVVVIVGGLLWFAWAKPNSFLQSVLPSSVTTIIQPTNTTEKVSVPTAVSRGASSILGVYPTPPAGTTVTGDLLTGQAVLLASGGWVWTTSGVIPSGSGISLASDRQTFSVTTRLNDTITPSVFFKSNVKNGQALDLVEKDGLVDGQTVWVVTKRLQAVSITPRKLRDGGATGWQTCERWHRQWMFDQEWADPLGGVVLNERGQAIAMVTGQGQLVFADMVQPVLDQVIQRSTLDRPSCGFRLTTSADALVNGVGNELQWIVGATGSDEAVVKDGPANQAGIQSGDRITKIDGQDVSNNPGDLFRGVRLGQKISIELLRAKKAVTVTMTIGVAK